MDLIERLVTNRRRLPSDDSNLKGTVYHGRKFGRMIVIIGFVIGAVHWLGHASEQSLFDI